MVICPMERPEIPEELLHGHIKIGNINMFWDLRDFKREMDRLRQIQDNYNYFVCKDGRIIMFNLGIY